ncbi:MAG TPA: transglycosylase domain-containing protein [Ideonella sp.]|jgi:monofunctional biosynthetic peptidoglycan transglycosylase|nr:transglycosylase domain-containing protein [Ideonella sp.]
MKAGLRSLARLLGALVICGLALQLYFVARIALMNVVAPESTSFQRSEVWRLVVEKHRVLWSQQWVDDEHISANLKRAVIASEDASFTDHSGVEWDAIEAAFEKNQKAEARAQRINEQLDKRETQRANAGKPVAKPAQRAAPKLVGGSTITQQLAKNLFLSGERTAVRKGQEIVIAYMLEALLDKRRILVIYLNSVEWGEGIFGAQAAARHYFHVDAAQVGAYPAARLAVMLPAPKRFEKNPGSAYVSGRAGTIVARMNAVELP